MTDAERNTRSAVNDGGVRLADPHRDPLVTDAQGRLPQLDGWRGISILCILACHLLPLGPKVLKLNSTAGPLGMSLFFTLSGFLITSFLIRRPEPSNFLIRRLCRILPLAWAAMAILLVIFGGGPEAWLSNLLFALNYQHEFIIPANSHLWSLCVEMHFYLFVAAVVLVGGRKALLVLPVLCLAVTANRVWTGTEISIVTHLRVDEILAGACLALLCYRQVPEQLAMPMRRIPPWAWAVLLLVVCHPYTGPAQFSRPYAAALLVGSTLLQPEHWLSRRLGGRVLRYLATVSYALYVIHGPLRIGWFDEGGKVFKYLVKRPITFALTFLLAHISTYYWEAMWISLGRRWTRRDSAREAVPVPAGS
jgi:peptidoglycan/LPS O-acetylase OafA/YrhL